MATVAELIPGDVVASFGVRALYVEQAKHPVWPHLRLVIWKLADRSWCLDALDARQEVGEVIEGGSGKDRRARLQGALAPGV